MPTTPGAAAAAAIFNRLTRPLAMVLLSRRPGGCRLAPCPRCSAAGGHLLRTFDAATGFGAHAPFSAVRIARA